MQSIGYWLDRSLGIQKSIRIETIPTVLLLYIALGLELYNVNDFYDFARLVNPSILDMRERCYVLLVITGMLRLWAYEYREHSLWCGVIYAKVSIIATVVFAATFAIKPITYLFYSV